MAEITVGQRIMLTLDCVRVFTQKDESGSDVQLQRVYHLNLPYGAPYEEVYSVLEEFVQNIKETEKASKERAAKEEAAKNTSVEESKTQEDTQEEIANL